MTMNILDHHNGIIDKDADGEYECKEGHPVEGITVDIGDEDRECKGDGNGNTHHDRFSPAEGKRDEERHGDSGEKHMFEQFVRFVLRGFAIVSRCGYLDL